MDLSNRLCFLEQRCSEHCRFAHSPWKPLSVHGVPTVSLSSLEPGAGDGTPSVGCLWLPRKLASKVGGTATVRMTKTNPFQHTENYYLKVTSLAGAQVYIISTPRKRARPPCQPGFCSRRATSRHLEAGFSRCSHSSWQCSDISAAREAASHSWCPFQCFVQVMGWVSLNFHAYETLQSSP